MRGQLTGGQLAIGQLAGGQLAGDFLGGVGQLAGDFLKVVLKFGFFNFIDTKHTGLNSSKCFTSTVIGIQGKTRL